MKKNIRFTSLALLIIAVIALWQYSVWQAKNKAVQEVSQESIQENTNKAPVKADTISAQSNIDITFTFTDTDTKTISYPLAKNNTKNLFAISQEIARQKTWDFQYQDYGELGYLVTKINNTKNGQDNKYWQYFVGGEQPQISANKYIPKAGEKIEWRFAESKF